VDLPWAGDDGHGFPLTTWPAASSARWWPAPVRRGVEWQGRRKGPQGKHLRQLACAVAQALGAGAEGVDEGAVLGAELELDLLVGGVDKGCGAAVGGGGRLCGSWAKMAVTLMHFSV